MVNKMTSAKNDLMHVWIDWRKPMKALPYFLLLSTFSLPPQLCLAQAPPQEKKSEERAQPTIPVKVQVVFSEYEGEKKVSSMPYSFTVIANEKVGGYYSASLRTGVRVPVDAGGPEQKTNYMDVGSNIDCGLKTTDDDRYQLHMIFERSALSPSSGVQSEKLQLSRPDVPPLVRQFKASVNMILKDGQTSETISTDPINGHSLHLSVTINVPK
jgi:hypothetical protein